ncbi:MAG: tetratricopeptide repeat protein [Nannocystaceae bacterium]|nr:tetratricopeptide repeat protein [Myxococcales bacterium]
MAVDDENHDHDIAQEAVDDLEPEGELVIDESGEDEEAGDALDEEGSGNPEIVEAASRIAFVSLPISCTNEGRGAPLAMGIQRWWAQELAQLGANAAAPVFTAFHEREGRKIPALMVFREAWTDDRALEGIGRFPNARHALITDMHVQEDKLAFKTRLVEVDGKELREHKQWEFEGGPDTLGPKIHGMLGEFADLLGVELKSASWDKAFGTENTQAMISFLVGLGNLSALQGRCVPTTSDQLLSPLMDALNREPKMDVAMQAIHAMTDILLNGQPDQAAIPLSVQALSLAAQKRKTDQGAWHHLAVVLRRVGDLGGAVNAFQQALNINPQNTTVTATFIETLRQAGDLENALKVAKFAVENGNEGPVVLAQLGSLMIENDEFDEAEPFLRRAIEEGKVPSAYGDLANVLWESADDQHRAEDQQEALTLLAAAVELPRIARSTLDMLLDLADEEGNETAQQLLLKCADKHKDSSTVLRYAANMYLESDDREQARPFLDQILALQRRSLDDDAFARRALLSLNIDDFEDRYDQAIESVRSDDHKAQKAAAVFLREIIAKEPRYWQPHLMLALAVRGSEGDAAALGHLMNAVRLRPNDAEIRNLIAAILRKQGRPREAVDHLRAVVALNPRDIAPVIALATCMRDANMFEECRQICTAALQMVPNHPEFTKILGSLPPPKNQQN